MENFAFAVNKIFSIPGLSLVFGIFVFIFIWLALREVRTWYWKTNEMIELLKKIEENTKK